MQEVRDVVYYEKWGLASSLVPIYVMLLYFFFQFDGGILHDNVVATEDEGEVAVLLQLERPLFVRL